MTFRFVSVKELVVSTCLFVNVHGYQILQAFLNTIGNWNIRRAPVDETCVFYMSITGSAEEYAEKTIVFIKACGMIRYAY